MKTIVFILDIIVLGGLLFGMYALMGDAYTNGGIMTKVLLMAVAGGIFGALQAVYRKWLLPKEENKSE